MKVKTKCGEIETPNFSDIGPRTKYWAEALQDLLKVEEIYCVLGAALEEAYRAGGAMAMARILRGFNAHEEVVDADFKVIPEGGSGPITAEPASPGESSGPTEHPVVDGSVPGGPEESPPSQ